MVTKLARLRREAAHIDEDITAASSDGSREGSRALGGQARSGSVAGFRYRWLKPRCKKLSGSVII